MRHAACASIGVVTVAMGLAACGNSSSRDSAPAQSAPASVPAPAAPAPSTPAPAPATPTPEAPASATPAAPAITGLYEAMSNTAMSITGDLDLSPTVLTFTLDQDYEAAVIGQAVASTDYGKGAGSWADLLGVPTTASIELRNVSAEHVGAKARNKGVCAPAKATFLALASAVDQTGGKILALAAFKGDTAPGPQGDPSDLCGTFTYTPIASAR